MANASRLDAAFIEKQRQRLTKLRAALLEASRREESEEDAIKSEMVGGGPRDYEDDAQRLTMLELEGNLVVRDIERLRQVDRALRKIEEGTYGFSDLSGKPMPRERLEAVPESILTLEEEEVLERRLNHK
jgi:DnaK suppressor protein